MRPTMESERHARTGDLIAAFALLGLVFGAIFYLTAPASETQTTAFIVPSQTLRS